MKEPIITQTDMNHSTFINVLKLFPMIEALMETQAEILAKLNNTSIEAEKEKIHNLHQHRIDVDSIKLKADLGITS